MEDYQLECDKHEMGPKFVRAKEFEISNYTQLDTVLVKLCSMIMDNYIKNPKNSELVAAAIIDPNNNIVASTSKKISDDEWIHAERAALYDYQEKYGEVPKGSIIVTTLSPCNEFMGDRYNKSCTELINSNSIKKVYCGYLDPTQHKENREFTQLETNNRKIREVCKDIANLFLKPAHKQDEVSERFITESRNQVEYEGVELHVYKDGASVEVIAWDGENQIGYVVFDRDGQHLVSTDTVIHDEYKGRGIARKIYDYAKSLGFTIRASSDQTAAGKHFWEKNRGTERVRE